MDKRNIKRYIFEAGLPSLILALLVYMFILHPFTPSHHPPYDPNGHWPSGGGTVPDHHPGNTPSDTPGSGPESKTAYVPGRGLVSLNWDCDKNIGACIETVGGRFSTQAICERDSDCHKDGDYIWKCDVVPGSGPLSWRCVETTGEEGEFLTLDSCKKSCGQLLPPNIEKVYTKQEASNTMGKDMNICSNVTLTDFKPNWYCVDESEEIRPKRKMYIDYLNSAYPYTYKFPKPNPTPDLDPAVEWAHHVKNMNEAGRKERHFIVDNQCTTPLHMGYVGYDTSGHKDNEPLDYNFFNIFNVKYFDKKQPLDTPYSPSSVREDPKKTAFGGFSLDSGEAVLLTAKDPILSGRIWPRTNCHLKEWPDSGDVVKLNNSIFDVNNYVRNKDALDLTGSSSGNYEMRDANEYYNYYKGTPEDVTAGIPSSVQSAKKPIRYQNLECGTGNIQLPPSKYAGCIAEPGSGPNSNPSLCNPAAYPSLGGLGSMGTTGLAPSIAAEYSFNSYITNPDFGSVLSSPACADPHSWECSKAGGDPESAGRWIGDYYDVSQVDGYSQAQLAMGVIPGRFWKQEETMYRNHEWDMTQAELDFDSGLGTCTRMCESECPYELRHYYQTEEGATTIIDPSTFLGCVSICHAVKDGDHRVQHETRCVKDYEECNCDYPDNINNTYTIKGFGDPTKGISSCQEWCGYYGAWSNEGLDPKYHAPSYKQRSRRDPTKMIPEICNRFNMYNEAAVYWDPSCNQSNHPKQASGNPPWYGDWLGYAPSGSETAKLQEEKTSNMSAAAAPVTGQSILDQINERYKIQQGCWRFAQDAGTAPRDIRTQPVGGQYPIGYGMESDSTYLYKPKSDKMSYLDTNTNLNVPGSNTRWLLDENGYEAVHDMGFCPWKHWLTPTIDTQKGWVREYENTNYINKDYQESANYLTRQREIIAKNIITQFHGAKWNELYNNNQVPFAVAENSIAGTTAIEEIGSTKTPVANYLAFKSSDCKFLSDLLCCDVGALTAQSVSGPFPSGIRIPDPATVGLDPATLNVATISKDCLDPGNGVVGGTMGSTGHCSEDHINWNKTQFGCSPYNEKYGVSTECADYFSKNICFVEDWPKPLEWCKQNWKKQNPNADPSHMPSDDAFRLDPQHNCTYATALKKSCPHAYSWQFDDLNSTYKSIGADYYVTLCPPLQYPWHLKGGTGCYGDVDAKCPVPESYCQLEPHNSPAYSGPGSICPNADYAYARFICGYDSSAPGSSPGLEGKIGDMRFKKLDCGDHSCTTLDDCITHYREQYNKEKPCSPAPPTRDN